MSDITERGPESRPPRDPEPDQIGRPLAPGEAPRHPDEPALTNPGGTSHEDFDRDIDIPAIVKLTAGLVVVTVVSFVAMWFFFVGLVERGERLDPEALPQPEAAEPFLPPAPRLQATPELELEELRDLEDRQLEGYGMVDEAAGRARIPIDRAMEIVAERLAGRDLPAPSASGEPVGPAGPAPAAGAPAADPAAGEAPEADAAAAPEPTAGEAAAEGDGR